MTSLSPTNHFPGLVDFSSLRSEKIAASHHHHHAMSVMIQSIVPPPAAQQQSPRREATKRQKVRHVVERVYEKSLDDFAADVKQRFTEPLDSRRLLAYSAKMQAECADRLQESKISMLPSYQHTLPTGRERGDVLALDVGGSTFRVALIRLAGKAEDGRLNGDGLQVRRIRSFQINKAIRDLKGEAFFDWMAEKIGEILEQYKHTTGNANVCLPMGLSWSFPIEQTCPRSGKLLSMGKGFCATHGVEGQDISELIMRSCRRKGLNVEMRAIVNDGQATLMTQAYRDPTTRMALILGTGTNAAVHFPVRALGKNKFGQRPDSWYAAAEHVTVNTELSMVGKNTLPTTSWDDELNAKHTMPDFQPLEYLVAGRYLGEIARLILVDATYSAGMFDGQLPDRMDEAYSFETQLLAEFEHDTSSNLENSRLAFLKAHPTRTPLSQKDLLFMQSLAKLISTRAAAFLATSLHSLWTLRTEAEGLRLSDKAAQVTIACDGALVGKYPGLRQRCQRFLGELCSMSRAEKGAVRLQMAAESSIFGAAVAVGCLSDA